MENWSPLLYSALGALTYIANSELLPTWSHTLVGVFSGLTFGIAYWLIGNNLKMLSRVLISVAVTIAAAMIVRILSI